MGRAACARGWEAETGLCALVVTQWARGAWADDRLRNARERAPRSTQRPAPGLTFSFSLVVPRFFGRVAAHNHTFFGPNALGPSVRDADKLRNSSCFTCTGEGGGAWCRQQQGGVPWVRHPYYSSTAATDRTCEATQTSAASLLATRIAGNPNNPPAFGACSPP